MENKSKNSIFPKYRFLYFKKNEKKISGVFLPMKKLAKTGDGYALTLRE